ncbi:stalk domain-containing protein [Paenibacillus sp. HJGM_3]|uniref:stalk domain-containing protein n=1 Tax=Paenibacillus sp. HJGM_3 TaxID=3379816 RepID=UPI003869A390
MKERNVWKRCMRHGVVLTLGALVAGGWLSSAAMAAEDNTWPLHLKAEQYVQSGQASLALPIWDDLMRRAAARSDWMTAALYAGYLDEHYDAIHDYEQAVYYYELESEYWLKDGKDWGSNDYQRAQQLKTTIELYASAVESDELRRAALPASGQLAKFEPEYGAYIGIYSEQDPGMSNYFNRSKSIYGKNHAIYLAYATYGESFPRRYADNAKSAGGALQIAWQPLKGLAPVLDDAYLREWAKQAAAAGIPIFLRFAGEMNGDWTPWAGDPQVYIEKFRTVARVMHELAPNVAMVWSPGDVPRYTMDLYYPGDEYTDWVGLSLYTEPLADASKTGNLLGTTPIERLDEMYRLYADRKPIMLSETGVSHYSSVDGQSYVDYAALNLERLYRVMPLKYPRLKAITYYNVGLVPGAKDNYSLREDERLFELYKTTIADEYYLTSVKTGEKPDDGIGYRDGSKPFEERTKWVPFVRIPDVYIGKVQYVLNGTIFAAKTNPPFEVDVKAGDVPQGSVLEIQVYSREGRLAGTRSFSVSSQVSVSIDGVRQSFEQPPVIVNGSTLTPLRAIFERMGAQVSWNDATKTATGTKNGKTVSITIGSSVAIVNGNQVPLEQPAQLIGGFTMGPARFIGEAFGGHVTWEGATRHVTIVSS